MARIVPIRVSKRDLEEYRRLQRNAKAKIRRVQKNYGVDLSAEINVGDSIDDFATRDQFNQWKDLMDRFTSGRYTTWRFKRNRYGVVMRESEINKLAYDTKRVRRQARNLISELEKRTEDSDDPLVRERMFQRRNDSITMPGPFNFEDVRSQHHFDLRRSQMGKRANEDYYDQRMATMRDNYADIIEKDVGRDSRASELIRNMNALDFFEIYMKNPEIFDFVFWDSDREGADNNPNESREQDTLEYLRREGHGDWKDDLHGFFNSGR